LFYGWDGTQLQTWRQNIGATGSQVIISRAAGGYPEVPRQELYWRKVSDFEEKAPTVTPTVAPALQLPSWALPVAVSILALGGLAIIAYYMKKK